MSAPLRALLLLPLLATACVSASKRVDQGIRLEQSGRPAEAARRYADALRRDPSLADARARLQESGDRAVADLIGEAGVAAPPEAADAYVEADALLRLAGAVGVTLRVPESYPADRRAAFDRAIDASVAAAEEAAARGDYEGAISRLSRAGARWEASTLQRTAISRARFDHYLGWAQSALQAGRYRLAHQRAGDAIEVFGPGSPDAPRAMDIQGEALRLGTVRVAVLPASVTSDQRGRLPGALLTELNDELTLERWRQEPLFIEVADPREVMREARRRGYLNQAASRTEARAIADAMRSELAAMLVIDSVAVDEVEVQQSRVAARTRAGADTAYALRSGRHRVRVRMGINLIDVDGLRQAERDTVWADASVRFRRATYRGDAADLVLPERADREAFAAAEPRLGSDEVTRLAAALAERAERRLYQTLGQRIR